MLFVNQILAHLTGPKSHSDILVYENSDIYMKILIYQLLQRKIFQLFCILLGMYLEHFTNGCALRNPIPTVIITNNAYHF